MKNRRDFIRTASVAAAAGIVAPSLAFKSSAKPDLLASNNIMKNKEVGLQIYTLRNKLRDGLEPVLEKVAEIGYKNIEAFSMGGDKVLGKEPAELKALADSLGLKVISSHMGIQRMTIKNMEKVKDSWKELIERFHTVGVKYLANAYLAPNVRSSICDYKNWAESFNYFGEMCKDAGITFGYHNHDFEFDVFDGQMGYDVLLNETEPDLMMFEPDLYWFKRADKDPVEYMKNHPGRFKLWHLKDMEDNEDKDFAEVGHGVIDFERIFEVREEAGLELIFVEQDSCKRDEYESIKMSFDYINEAKFIKT